MLENERLSAINPGEEVEEKVSLSDRFRLGLGQSPSRNRFGQPSVVPSDGAGRETVTRQ
jgi:hypothetical protein